jgi:hypothetical protein
MKTKISDLQAALDRLAVAELSQYECEQNRKAAHQAVGIELRRERVAKGLSLRKLAEEIGCSAPFLSDCELGRRRLSPDKMNEYRRILQYA